MGRTNGKLLRFLMEALMFKKYENLRYEEDGEVFYIDLPRYHKEMKSHYANILKDWYRLNPHLNYTTYSEAKAVLKANIKKSVYVLSLPSHEKRLRFHFATKEETAEKRIQQKEKSAFEKIRQKEENSAMHDDPPSVGSSGYHSAENYDSDTALHQDIPDPQICFPGMPNLNTNTEFQKENCPTNLDSQASLDIDWDSILKDANSSDSSLAEWDELILNIFEDMSMDQAPNPDLNQLQKEQDNSVAPTSIQELAVPQVSGLPKSWVCNSKVSFGTVVQYVFQPENNLPYESVSSPNHPMCLLPMDIPQTSPRISVELYLRADWLADGKKTLQKHEFISGTSAGEIYLILYFI